MDPRFRPLALAALIALAVPALAAPAAAGTEDAPELADEPGDAANPVMGTYGDLVAGWIENETPTEFTAVIKYAGLDNVAGRGSGAGLAFRYRGVDYYAFGGLDENGAGFYWHGHIERATVTMLDQADSTGETTLGAPGYHRVVVPKAFLLADQANGTGPGEEVLSDFEAASFDFKTYAAILVVPNPPLVEIDRGTGTGTYALAVPIVPPEEPALPEAGNLTNATQPGETLAPAETPASNPVPLPAAVALAALAGAARATRRRP